MFLKKFKMKEAYCKSTIGG